MRTPRNILVTGSSGFIGFPTAAALASAGRNVVGVDLIAPEAGDLAFEPLVGDFSNFDFVQRLIAEREIDTIVHAGGISGPMVAPNAPYLVCTANVGGTINLLEAARVRGVGRFVYCSSASAYGNTPPAPVPDDPPMRATDVYGASKAAADMILRAYREQHQLDAISLRISNGYGPRRRTRCAIREMIQNSLRSQSTHFSWGRGYGRTYLYVDDAVRAILAAVEVKNVPQWSYNITGAEFRQMEEIAEIVRRLFPGAAILFEAGTDPMGYRREQLDISAARRDLGWMPAFTLEKGIAAYARYLREFTPVTAK